MTNTVTVSSPLTLSRGITIKNRLFKSAMSEQLGTKEHNPGAELPRLYKAWADGGIGVSVTGNVMVDRTALGEPKNVVLDDQSNPDLFKEWAKQGTSNNTHLWMQLNHPGKQSPGFLSKVPVAPSAIPLEGGLKSAFNTPRELEESEIITIAKKFGHSAGLAKKSGFTGVQIHCAHGYLLSQFLSPWHNQRKDDWGGSIDNRMRLLLEVYRAIRKEVGETFPVALKLNSADFREGGFSFEDSKYVAIKMQEEGIDLIEISGGTYENPNMTGHGAAKDPDEKEAYFIKYAESIRKDLSIPLVVTGGFRSGKAMNSALASGVTDMIGIARPLAVDPDCPNKLLADNNYVSKFVRPSTGSKALDMLSMLEITWYEFQLYRIGRGKKVNPYQNAWSAVILTFWRMGAYAFKQRRARS